MTTARPAKLAFLTQPAPGVYLLNLRVEGEDFYRLEISRAQLGNIIVDGAGMALRDCGRPVSRRTAANPSRENNAAIVGSSA